VIVGTAAAAPQVAVLDAYGHPVSGRVVVFAVPTSGATGAFAGGASSALAVTGANGIAAAPTFTANNTIGSYALTATVAGIAAPVTFTFSNTVATTTTLTDNGPNPSNFGDTVSFTATVSGGSVITGETVFIEDADNANAVVASPTLSSGAVTFTISNLGVGTHHLFAVYNGDGTHFTSNSSLAPVIQVVIGFGVAPAVSSVVVNGGAPAYSDSQGHSWSLAGQNSVVEQILVTFSEAVTLGPGAFSIINNAAGVTVNSGAAPNTLPVTAVWGSPVVGSGNTQWVVTFSGPGTTALGLGGVGHVIKDGLYQLHINAAAVTAMVGGLPMAANSDTGFWAMYGAVHDNSVSSTIGDGTSEVFLDGNDFIEFKNAFNSLADSSGPPYDVAMDYDLDGFYDGDTFTAFRTSFNALKDWSF
jgi:hypothetical protein